MIRTRLQGDTPFFPNMLNNGNVEVCLKEDVDKVIAEKDEKIDELKESIDELQKATDSAWSKVNGMYDELRYQKFKRCLAMAKWCKLQDDNFFKIHSVEHLQMRRAEYKRTFYRRWRKRWLELAEKFKEAK